MFLKLIMDGKPAVSYAEIGQVFDRRYRVRGMGRPFSPDMQR